MSLQATARGKRKKSGAEYRRKKLARIDEEEKLSSFMVDFLKNSAKALHDDDVAAIGEPVASCSVVAPVNVTDLDSPRSRSVSFNYDSERCCREGERSRDACYCGQRE